MQIKTVVTGQGGTVPQSLGPSSLPGRVTREGVFHLRLYTREVAKIPGTCGVLVCHGHKDKHLIPRPWGRYVKRTESRDPQSPTEDLAPERHSFVLGRLGGTKVRGPRDPTKEFERFLLCPRPSCPTLRRTLSLFPRRIGPQGLLLGPGPCLSSLSSPFEG